MVKTAASSSSSNNNKYKGVWKRKWGKYVSEIRLPNSRERIWLGSYETAEKAARAFDAALFCLRGRNAKFNFPDDPPNVISTNIAGTGKSLTPVEIQTVAQQHGNSYVHPKEFEDTIDWSFLDSLDNDHLEHHEERDHVHNVYSSFGVFQETGDMYIPVPALHSSPICGTDDHDHGSVADFTSFLWNFDSST